MAFKLGNRIYGIASLAPMAGFSDRAMRRICHEYGAALSVTEMISAKAVTFGDKKTRSLAAIRPDEGDVILQIFGSEPDTMARAAESLCMGVGEGYSMPVAIDINMGCPVHKIFSNGEGSALMRDPELIYRIVRAVADRSPIPVTVKIRAGIDEAHINAVECARAAESAGASMITVHGRTRAQMYSGLADRGIIKAVKDSLRIPVLANGDVTDAPSAASMLADTGCDGVMIGRGAVGNPFLFEQIQRHLSGLDERLITPEERVRIALLQLELAIEEKGETTAVLEARKQIALYFKGWRGSAALRAGINSACTLGEVKALLKGLTLEEEKI